MADTNKITYVSLENLEYYDEKIKSHIGEADAAVQANIDAEVTRAKAAEATNAAAAETAQDAADAAQADVDALEAKVGTVPDGSTVMGIITNIQESAYDDTEIRGLISDNTSAIDAIEADYLKAADKTALNSLIETAQAAADKAQGEVDALETTHATDKAALVAEDARIVGLVEAEASRAAGVEEGLDSRLEEVEAFFKLAEGESLDTALDTLVEIQNYITSEGSAADQMVLDIAANAKAISDMDTAYKAADSTLQGNIDTLSATVDTKAAASDLNALTTRVTTAEGDIDALEGRMDTAESDIDALQALFGDGEGSVSDQINDAVAAEAALREQGDTDAIAAAATDATSKANQALADAKAYADAEDAKIEIRVDALETASATHALASDLTALADRVTTAEGEIDTLQSEMDTVEALAAANKAAHEANAAAIALKASQADLEALEIRVAANETAIESFVECSTEEINALFA